MYRDFFTSKWVLGGFAFLIVFGVACIVWYHYDTAPYKRDVAKTKRIAQQRQNAKKADTSSKTEDEKTSSSEEYTTQTTEKPMETILEENTPHMSVSPYGFGPYPEIPTDFPESYKPPWTWSEHERQELVELSGDSGVLLGGELTFRVYIKMWNEGIRELPGIAVDPENHLMSLTRTNTAYVTYGYRDGTQERYLSHVKRTGKATELTNEDILTGNIPEDVRIVPFNEMETLDPYTYLGLKR